MSRIKLARIGFAILVLVLAASLALNIGLYLQARLYYREVNDVRLDPLGTLTREQWPPLGNRAARRVVFYGDSRAAQWPAPRIERYEFINRGIGAQTSAQVLGRFAAHIAPLKPDVLVVQVCINDLKAIGIFAEQEAAIIEQCKQHLRGIVAAARANGIRQIVLTTVFPTTGDVPVARRMVWSGRIDIAANALNEDVRTWSASDVVILDAAQLLSNDAGQLRRDYSVDLLHLNEAGYRVLNEALVKLLR